MASETRIVGVELTLDGHPALADIPAERTFRSGSRGFYTTGKAVIDGRRYQVAVTMTEIGSKPQAAGPQRNGPVTTRRA